MFGEVNDWIIEISCPFCGATVLETTDFSKIPEDMSDDEREEIELSEDDCNFCEHVAFFSDWAYAGPEIPNKWKKEMTLLAGAIQNKEVDSNAIVSIIDHFRTSGGEDGLKRLAEKVLPDYDLEFVEEFVCKNNGCSGTGGSNYGIIFLQKKTE